MGSNVCSGDIVKVLSIVGTLISIIKIAVPIVLIVYGMIDLLKAITAQKDDQIKKQQQIFLKRLLIGAMVYLVPTIVGFCITTFADKNVMTTSCLNCIFDTSTCESGSGNGNNNSTCASYSTKNDCERNVLCRWETVQNFSVSINSNNGNYCVNTYFNN